MDLTPGFKQEGTTFDRFGLCNMMKSGGAATIYFDDVGYNGQRQDFSQDPSWVATGNRVTFGSEGKRARHNFGFQCHDQPRRRRIAERSGGGLRRTGGMGFITRTASARSI